MNCALRRDIFISAFNSCKEIQDKIGLSGVYKIKPSPDAWPITVYCEMVVNGGGYTFLPRSLTRKPRAQNIINALFKDKKNVLLKLQRKSDRSILIQPHPSFANTNFGVLVNSFSGYTTPLNAFMKDYILPWHHSKICRSESWHSRLQSQRAHNPVQNLRHKSQQLVCVHAKPQSSTSNSSGYGPFPGIDVQWRVKAIPITNPDRMMPNEYFFLTELHFGGCGCLLVQPPLG